MMNELLKGESRRLISGEACSVLTAHLEVIHRFFAYLAVFDSWP